MKRHTFFPFLLLISTVIPALRGQNDGRNGQTFSKIDLAVQAIREAYSIRTGTETAADDADIQPINLDLGGKDIPEVFRHLVSQRRAYSWVLENGVYDLYPAANGQGLSEITVHAFILKDASRLDASQELSKLPELQKWLSDHHASRKEIINESTYRNKDQRVSLSLSDMPLRTVLNELIGSFGDTQWAISHYGDRMQYVAIYF